MKKWLLLGGAIAAEVSGTLALRGAVDDAVWIPVVVAGYLVAFVLLALTLREGMPVGVAYGIWGASGVALTALLAAVIFEELLSFRAVAGIVLIIVGVVLVETGARVRARALP
ncbi:MAG TPA: SMR family transporter [Acidimicrobiia bacterium]|nr:SMR family transporter [Acidimicrobiia bacterium]